MLTMRAIDFNAHLTAWTALRILEIVVALCYGLIASKALQGIKRAKLPGESWIAPVLYNQSTSTYRALKDVS